MSLLEQVKEAGVIGAGGAGFPTHAKLNCKAEYILMNGAECEPAAPGGSAVDGHVSRRDH